MVAVINLGSFVDRLVGKPAYESGDDCDAAAVRPSRDALMELGGRLTLPGLTPTLHFDRDAAVRRIVIADVPCIVYTPSDFTAGNAYPALLYIHGGGWTVGRQG